MFYHYCRNIRERALELGLFKKINKDEVNNFLNEFYKMPFIFHDKNKILDDLKEKYSFLIYLKINGYNIFIMECLIIIY